MFGARRISPPPPGTPSMGIGSLPRQQADLSCGLVTYLRHGAGPSLLLVHGIPTSARLWEPLVGELGEHCDCAAGPTVRTLGSATRQTKGSRR